MDIVYAMPNQDHRLFINMIYACPNECHFCIDFFSETFFGYDLKHGRSPTLSEISSALRKHPSRDNITEVYICGIGEPLLVYDRVIAVAKQVRTFFKPGTLIGINTSGTYYKKHPRVDFAEEFDLIQVSLNAENEEKYNQICRPKIHGAYRILMSFLISLKKYIQTNSLKCRVELSIIDPSDIGTIINGKFNLELPEPNIAKCAKVAEGFGWPLKVKPLIRENELTKWAKFAQAKNGIVKSNKNMLERSL